MLDLSNVWPEWQAVELLGEGSFGKVYRCVREEYGMKFESAVKVISLPSSRAEVDSFFAEGMSEEQIKTFYAEIVEDFASEIKMLFLLKGAPNIVAVENYKIVERKNEIGWDIYILMEYLESFAKYSHGKNLTEADIKALALDMCTALKSCGKYNVIHRDIKPGNIFIDRFGSFKLGDFSIARQLEGTMDFMSKKGTFGYMAPEVFRGESYDFRVDIYSLGRVLYKLLNRNKEPFIDVNKEFVSFKDRNESLERIRKGEKLPAPVDASPAMAAVILKACEYNASDRFASVEEFKAALEAVPAVTEEPTVAAQDYFEKTVAAREIELPAPVPVEADCDDETVVIAPVSEEATEPLEAEETAILPDEDETVLAPADPDATMLADADYDEPTVMAEKDELPTDKESKNKKKKIVVFSILGIVAVAAIVLGILFGKGVLGSSNQNPPPAESEAESAQYHYTTAKELIESGDYAGAYSHLVQCLGYEDTNEMLENFVYGKSTSISFSYDNGVETQSDYYEERLDENGNVTFIDWGDSLSYFENSYDENGNLISTVSDGGSRIDYIRYSDGSLAEETGYDSNGNISYNIKYDEFGCEIYHLSTDIDGFIESENSYTYERDANGNIITETCYDLTTDENFRYVYEYDNDGNMVLGTSYENNIIAHRVEYDNNGNETLEIYYDDNGEWHSENEYKYDEYGNCIYIKQAAFQSETYETLYDIVYDNRGNIISRSYTHQIYNYDIVEDSEKVEYVYNEYGFVTQVTYYEYGEYTSKDVFEYEFTDTSCVETCVSYDENGNIYRKRIYTRSDPVGYSEPS